MNQAIIWVHGDNLNPQQPALSQNRQTPAIFVFDQALLNKREISLKRILFIYECLLELPVTIRRGPVASEIATFAREHRAGQIITMASVSPGFSRIVSSLGRHGFEVQIMENEPFLKLPQEPDLRRFSRYWRLAKNQLNSKQG